MDECQLTSRPQGDATGIGAVLLLGFVFAFGVAVGRASNMGRGKERRLRERAADPETSTLKVRILGACRSAIRDTYDRDFDELPQAWKLKIETAVLDAESSTEPDAMRLAAVAEYRYLAKRESWAKSAEGDDD